MAADDVILQLDDIVYAYPQGPPVLDGVNFRLLRGEKVGLIGDNGSGKTTLAHLIVGLKRPAAGRITLCGREMRGEADFREMRQRVGLLFQDADDQLFCPTVLEDVAFGPLNQGKEPREARRIARQTLADLGLEGFEERVTYRLSGGEKRMVALATVLAMAPELLLLDEPTTGLDRDTRHRLLGILKRLDLAFILISHDYDFLAEVTDSVYSMQQGRIVVDDGTALHSHYHVHSLGRLPHEHSP